MNDDTLVSHYDYGNAEWFPSEGSVFEFGPGKSVEDSYVQYDDLFQIIGHTSLGLQVLERSLGWNTSDFPDYDDFIAYEYDVINLGTNVLNGVFVSWNYDCDVASIADPSNPHLDDLVDFDGWHSSEYTDWHGVSANLEVNSNLYIDIVENIDLNNNQVFDGYDEYGVPYGDPYNPRYDAEKIHPDGYPDEWQVYIRSEGDTLLIPRNMSYMYDSDNPGTPEEDTGELDLPNPNTGYIGGRLIYTGKSPFFETSDDSLIRPFSHQWWTWEVEPRTDLEKYQYMAGIHPFSFGQKFMLNPLAYDSTAFDYRLLLSAGPFNNFAPGDTLQFVYVAAVGLGLAGLRENMDNAMNAYYSGSSHSDPANPSNQHQDFHWVIKPTSVKNQLDNLSIPTNYSLSDNYPNPFNSETIINYSLPKDSYVHLEIYNMRGQRVKTLINSTQTACYKQISWDGTDEHSVGVGSGIYIYKIQAGNFIQAGKMVLAK